MPIEIKNVTAIATTALRMDALNILLAGMRAVDPSTLMHEQVRVVGNRLHVRDQEFDLGAFRRLFVIGIGKASYVAARALEDILGNRIYAGIVLDVQSGDLRRLKSIAGTHPLPSQSNIEATGQIVSLLKEAGEGDLVISIISGGGSALLCWPYRLKCDETILLTKALLASGASIEEINTVRKHSSDIQGGQFAALAAPARLVSLIFSDVPGDDIGMVASGPTVLDTTTVADAHAIVEKYALRNICRHPNCDLHETPKDPSAFAHVTNILMAGNTLAAAAMKKRAAQLGYSARILTTALRGEARDAGVRLAREVEPGEALVAAGETTVTLRGKGRGGRNQELALGAMNEIDANTIVLSCASDGIDNSPAAGAIADALTREHARTQSLDPNFFLRENNSFAFFQKTGDHIMTGITGTNVSDLMLALKART